jgi:hypothetical protein
MVAWGTSAGGQGLACGGAVALLGVVLVNSRGDGSAEEDGQG